MAYQRTEYNREVRRDDRDDEPKQSWKSWFGLGGEDKDREDRDRGYNYSNTTTYRNQPGQYGDRETSRYQDRSSTGAYSTGYAGARGGYGYTSSDETTRPSWNSDRDYNTRQSYGQTGGDRDNYTRTETRTYGGMGGNVDRSYTPSYTPSYGNSNQRTEYTTTQRSVGDRDNTRDYQTSRYGQDSSVYGAGRSYGFDRDTTYSREHPSQMTTYSREHPSQMTSRSYGNSGYGNGGYGNDSTTRRETTYTSGGVGGYGGDSYSTRPSYQSSTYRY